MKKILNKIRNATYRFMSGRYGTDQLNSFLLTMSFVFLLPTLFIRNNIRLLFVLLFWVDVIYCYFRMFSKNIYSRQKENNWFVGKFNYIKTRLTQRKQYRFYNCPKCKTHLRVPRGAGNITITCKNCGYEFDKKA